MARPTAPRPDGACWGVGRATGGERQGSTRPRAARGPTYEGTDGSLARPLPASCRWPSTVEELRLDSRPDRFEHREGGYAFDERESIDFLPVDLVDDDVGL